MSAADGFTPRPLNGAVLSDPPASVQVPDYALDRVEIGIVHLGPGAFHRAHQAWFADRLLRHDPRWAISAVSLRSAGLRDALAAQDGLYTVAVLDREPCHRIIGAVRECLVASEDPQRVLARLAAPGSHLVTLTVTEKGYCLAASGELDFDHADIRHDLAQPRTPCSAIGYLVEGLRLRRAQGLPPYAVISCDNLADNGNKLRRAVIAYAERIDRDLARWIEEEAAFPRTMVDSIVPASDDALRARVRTETGIDDAWPVQREAWLQWVIADELRGTTPDWASVGVTLTDDVAGYESAKLRLLNGAHSALAYLGLLRGHGSVGEAMADDELAGWIRCLMREDIRPAVQAPRGLDLDHYIDAVLDRFRNPAIRHELAQIAWDGSKKLPFRLFGTLSDALKAGRPVDRLCRPIAAWFHFLRRAAHERRAVTDPLAETLIAVAAAGEGSGDRDVARFLNLDQVFPPAIAADSRFSAALIRAYDELR